MSGDATSNLSAIEADSVRTWDPVVRRYVDIREGVVGLAPETLDTLAKIANSIANDPDYATYVDGQLAAKADRVTTYTKTETDGLVAPKANSADVTLALAAKADQATTYTKTETDSALAGVTSYVNATTYTKTETADLVAPKANSTDVTLGLATKADQATTYTKVEADNLLELKANQLTTYTKTEVDTIASGKQDKFIQGTIPATDAVRLFDAGDTKFRGVSATAPLAVSSNSEYISLSSDTYSKAEVDTKLAERATSTDISAAIDSLVGSAPGTLDTLNELAAALGDDPNFATTVTNQIATKAPLANPTFTGTVSGVTKAMVGLGSVDNTSDASKPVSAAIQAALDLKASQADFDDSAAAWSSGAVGDGYHYLDTGTDALVIRTDDGSTVAANFLGSVAGAQKGKTLFYQDVEIFGSLINAGLTSSLDAKADASDVYTKAEVDASQVGKQDKFIQGSIPAGAARLFDVGDTKFRGIACNTPLSIETTSDAVLTLSSDTYSKSEVYSKTESDARYESQFVAIAPLQQVANLNPARFELRLDTTNIAPLTNPVFPGSLEVVQDGIFDSHLLCGGNCSVTGQLRTNTISNLNADGTDPAITVMKSMLIQGDVLVDSMRASTANQLTIADNLTVTGDLVVNGSVSSAFWVAGRVQNMTILKDSGRHSFTITKLGTGFYQINFAQPHPDGANFIALSSGEGYSGSAWNIVSNASTTTYANTANRVVFIVRDHNMTAIDGAFNFVVLA